ncbi:UNVERIFIED_ORG: AraC family transcriptional regulator [Martelella mediterranea]
MAPASVQQTRILRSYFPVHEGWLGLFAYQVLRAGHIRTGPDHRIERQDVPGHEFLFCIKGEGVVTVRGRTHVVRAGEMAWLPVREPHAHRPVRENPWELLWLRVDSANLSRLMTVLTVHDDPVFHFAEPVIVETLLLELLDRLDRSSLAIQAACDRHVSALVEALVEARENRLLEPEAATHKGLGDLMAQIHAHYNEHWDIDKLAAACRVSKAQLFRLFQTAFGKTPLAWLRDYRMAQAKRLLVETADPVSSIAMAVGYSDPLYFSREFKKHAGLSPRAFRASESW